ncbi:hypothetical protein TorRG33x02_192610 [Trema orientale]|uniref:Uncharacterized protein n=1 Tax=Trema orientale TaxID=63057 RepID=A0A2P5EHK6_TREOI|nr:hypothetical protein TorRG33x02_192610 [Trema orientale]
MRTDQEERKKDRELEEGEKERQLEEKEKEMEEEREERLKAEATECARTLAGLAAEFLLSGPATVVTGDTYKEKMMIVHVVSTKGDALVPIRDAIDDVRSAVDDFITLSICL